MSDIRPYIFWLRISKIDFSGKPPVELEAVTGCGVDHRIKREESKASHPDTSIRPRKNLGF